MAKGVLGGVLPDPDKGKPHRHTRAKARLLMQDMSIPQKLQVIERLLDKRPEDTLDAIIAATGED